MTRITGTLIALGIVGVSPAVAQDTEHTQQLLPQLGVVLPPSSFQDQGVRSCADLPATSEFWTPTAAQIRQLDSLLAGVIVNQFEATGHLLPKGIQPPPGARLFAVGDYYRQYVGIISGGRPLIFINGFDKEYFDIVRPVDSIAVAHGEQPRSSDWRTSLVEVCDGGSLFFEALYDPNTKTILQLAFHPPG